MTTVEIVKGCLTWASVVLSGAAAFCWFKAATAIIIKDDPAALRAGGISQGGINIWVSVQRQGRWNQWAAGLTGAAVALQAAQGLL